MVNTEAGGNNAVPMNDESRLNDQQQGQAPAEEDEEDLDAIELREALKALNAEGEGGEGEPGPEQHQQQQQKTDPDPGEGGEQERQPGNPETVPYPRFVEVNNRLGALAEENAFLKGQLSVRGTDTGQEQPNGEKQQPAAQPDPAEQIAAINEKLDEVAGKFDDGELTAREWRKQERELSAQLDALQAPAEPEPAAQDPIIVPQGDSAYLTAQNRDLEAEYPRVNAMSDAHFDRLTADVTNQMIAEGHEMAGEAATLALRTRIAMNAEQMEQIYIAQDKLLAGEDPQPSSTPKQPETPARATPQQHAQKRELAAGMPPDLDQLSGSSTGGDEAVTDANIETMTDEEIMALPPAVRARWIGSA